MSAIWASDDELFALCDVLADRNAGIIETILGRNRIEHFEFYRALAQRTWVGACRGTGNSVKAKAYGRHDLAFVCEECKTTLYTLTKRRAASWNRVTG